MCIDSSCKDYDVCVQCEKAARYHRSDCCLFAFSPASTKRSESYFDSELHSLTPQRSPTSADFGNSDQNVAPLQLDQARKSYGLSIPQVAYEIESTELQSEPDEPLARAKLPTESSEPEKLETCLSLVDLSPGVKPGNPRLRFNTR